MNPAFDIRGLTAKLNKKYPSAIFVRCRAKAAMASGDVVILDVTAANHAAGKLTPVTTTTSADSVLTLGVVAEGQQTVPNGATVLIQICGLHPAVKIDGTTDIAPGDSVSTHTAAGVGDKAASATASKRLGVFVDDAYTTNSVADKKVFLINPFGIVP